MLFKPLALIAGLGAARIAAALGEERVITFPTTLDADLPLTGPSSDSQTVFDSAPSNNQASASDFIIASKDRKYAAPILLDSKDDVAVHIAAQTFAEDIYKVTGERPRLYNDTLPKDIKGDSAIVVGSLDSRLVKGLKGGKKAREALEGKWESYEIGVLNDAVKGAEQSLVIVGSDRRGTIYGLYTLSEQMGVSPWYFWSDVPIRPRSTVAFTRSKTLSHGEPTVKYRGLFINDEHPALWGWAQQYFKRERWEPALQSDFYRHWFEMLLRLKANYQWPAMYISMFSVDGLDITTNGFPTEPIPGPNKVLAQEMGIVMGTSHHEPMDRTKPEWDHVGKGPWDWTNSEVLKKHWKYGAERAKGTDTLFTMGMRGDGDEPLTGASLELVQNITAIQRGILKDVYGDEYKKIPKMWAMYKEVSDYYLDGLEIPDDVTVLFADDNWGNIMTVMDPEKTHEGGAGIYYHVDYVGFPRAYKWINTINLAKTAEQMNIARTFNTTEIWIVNVGSLKPLELPSEHFLALAYDSDRWPMNDVGVFLEAWATRDYGEEHAKEIADIMGHYGRYASRRKPELLNSTMWSYVNYEESERIQAEWDSLVDRSKKVYDALDEEWRNAFYENVYMLCMMQANINRLYIQVGKSNLLASQYRNSANVHAHGALSAFARDYNLTESFHSLLDRKWDHALDQSHINWQTVLEPDRDSLPAISFVNPMVGSIAGIPQRPLSIQTRYHMRVTFENEIGSWPGEHQWNCAAGTRCPDPTTQTLDPFGAQSRWFEVGSAGPREVGWKAKAVSPWLTLSATEGKLKMDASKDTRVYVGVDWEKVPKMGWQNGTVEIKGEDGANITLSVPVNKIAPPPSDFKGFVEGDGYVVMEAAHHSSSKEVDGFKMDELKWYGRTLSGVTMLPVSTKNFTAGEGPSISYDFWTHGDNKNGSAELTIQIGPSTNWRANKQLAFAYSLDKSKPKAVLPVSTKRLGPVIEKPGGPEIFVGAVPPDWLEVMRNDVRNVTIPVEIEKEGKHTLTLYGMSAGVVFERVWVDLGGIASRGYSYLGPPESMRV